MLLNYHELTMEESRNSPARKKQFRMICIVMVTCIVYSLITSGALRPVEVHEGVFPGGEFVYKTTGRDYAASMSLLESIASDLKVRERDCGNVLYNLYLDDPLAVNGRRQRFASGILLNQDTVTPKQESNEQRRALLMGKNAQIKEPTPKEVEDLSAHDLWKRLKYHSQELPRVKAAVVEYTFSNGFVSALLHSYKVFPALRQYAKDNYGAPGRVPAVLTTCSIVDSKCWHYVPLEDSNRVFRLGTSEYPPGEGGGHVNWEGVRKMLLKIMSLGQLGGDKVAIETTTTSTKKSEEKAPESVAQESTTTMTTTTTASSDDKEDTEAKEKSPSEEAPKQDDDEAEAPATEEEPPVETASEPNDDEGEAAASEEAARDEL